MTTKISKAEKVRIFKNTFSLEEAKKMQEKLEKNVTLATERLTELSGDEKGPMGLTPDNIKLTTEWQEAHKFLNTELSKLRNFNQLLVSAFKKELSEERKAKREGVSMKF